MNKVIIDIPGGFGNQLFGYAFGYALSKEVGAKYYIHTPFQDNGITWELQLRYLNLEYDGNITYSWTKRFLDRLIFNKARRRFRIGLSTRIDKSAERDSLMEYIDSYTGNTIYYGNWENEKFFKKYRNDLVRMITPKDDRCKEVLELIESISDSSSPTVGLHVRRGDKVAIGGSNPIEYYLKAVDMMKKRVGENVTFYVVSDDIEWCKERFTEEVGNFVFPEYESDQKTLDDWLILKACKHHIMGDTTYCWWAAWLSEDANQVVISPKHRALDKWIVCEV